MTNKEIIKHLADNNDYKYNLLKASEECQELALVLTQLALKPTKVNTQEIIDELGDVKIRLKILKHFFNEDDVKKRIKFKLNNFKEYVKQNKYTGGI
jgi:NTP pyrophosphatase (non-canonical NTP hydrolase)